MVNTRSQSLQSVGGSDDSSRESNFAKFWQGMEGKGYYPGTGLGLYICKQILEAHGGSIECSGAGGGGTKFIAKLPVTKKLLNARGSTAA